MYSSFNFEDAELTLKLPDGTIVSGIAHACCLKITQDTIDATTIGGSFKEFVLGPKTVYFESILSDIACVPAGASTEKPLEVKRLLRMIDG